MNTKKLGMIFIILGFLSILFVPINKLFHFFPNMDMVYLSSTGVVFLCCGTILRRKKAL